MSTGLECQFIKWEKDEWYYLLQNWDCPVTAWDWREYATCFGPFKRKDEAQEQLRRCHANPGGSETIEDPDHDDKVLQKHIELANQGTRSNIW